MKKYLLGMFAVILAVAFSSFSSTKQDLKLDGEVWFTYDGDGSGEGTNLNYHYDDEMQFLECPDEVGRLCNIKAEPTNPLADPSLWKPNLVTVVDQSRIIE